MTCKSEGNYLIINFYLPTIKKTVCQATHMHTPTENVLNKITKSTVNIEIFPSRFLNHENACGISKFFSDITKSKIVTVVIKQIFCKHKI